MGIVWHSLDHTRQAAFTTINHSHVVLSLKKYPWLGVARPCPLPVQVPHAARSQLKSAHACDAGWKQRPKELFHSTIFYIHWGNHLQFSALWLLCKVPNVKNVVTVSRERCLVITSKSTFMSQMFWITDLPRSRFSKAYGWTTWKCGSLYKLYNKCSFFPCHLKTL